MGTHLWEHEHSYYWTEGAYFKGGFHTEHDSWSDFFTGMNDSDEDLNLVCRWDWELEKDDDDRPIEPIGTGTLKVRYVLQRKGICMSHDVSVKPEDEPAVREWLQKKWNHMIGLWAPFAGGTP